MTRIIGTNTQNYRPFRSPRSGRPAGGSAPRITPTRAEVVNNEPVEEVIFELNSGNNQRARHRDYVITEPIEEVLVEAQAPKPAPTPEHFWQGFSTPFMAQVIGQNAAPADRRTRAYANAASTKTERARPHLRLAC